MNVQELHKIPLTALIWKLGSNSDKDIIALCPVTAPVQRWMNAGFDFLIMPATVVWLAPRYVEHDVGGTFKFPLFSELDPDDLSYVNISVQQVTSVTHNIGGSILQDYIASLPDHLKNAKIL